MADETRSAATGRRIYLASSWRNPDQPGLVSLLRSEGHEVYDFRNPRPGNTGFAWSEIDPDWLGWSPEPFRDLLVSHPIAASGFGSDFDAMKWADTFVLALPCGRSAHLEAGWAIGAGKPTAILLHEDKFEPELMYLMADLVAVTAEEVVGWLGGLEAARAAAAAAVGADGSVGRCAMPEPMNGGNAAYDQRSGSDAFLIRTGGTRTGEALRQEAMKRRLNDPDVVGLIHRFDHDDILTETEAAHWDVNPLPFGWWVVSDRRRSR